MKEQKRESENALNLARDFRRIAASHAEFKRTEGYIEDNYSIADIFNLEASLEVCRRGPADYFYETALTLFSQTLGRYHQETLSLVHEIIDYHVNNVKRMMIERNVVTAVILLGPVLLMAKHMFPTSVPMRLLALYGSFFSLYAYSRLEEWLLCFLERRHYQQMYNNILVLQNWLERIRKEVTNKVLIIKRISDFLIFPILAQPTLKKI